VSLCVNPECQKENSANDLFCQYCGSELLILGRYRIAQLLSDKGGFGNTYEVTYHNDTRVLKALKDTNPKAIELFRREFEVLKQANHPGIPTAAEYFELNYQGSRAPLHCFVMEKIIGIDLEEYIKQRARPIDQRCALDWLEQLTNIIAEIHSHNLLHRDIKPSNIILKPSGQLVLIDFGAVGISNRIPSSTQPQTFVFTPGYAAPEQILGKPVPQSDFFSLGNLFVYLLTLKGIDAPERRVAEQFTWHEHTDNISPELIDLIDRLIDDRVDRRPANAPALLAEIQALNLQLCPTASSFYPQAPTGAPTVAPTNSQPQPIAATQVTGNSPHQPLPSTQVTANSPQQPLPSTQVTGNPQTPPIAQTKVTASPPPAATYAPSSLPQQSPTKRPNRHLVKILGGVGAIALLATVALLRGCQSTLPISNDRSIAGTNAPTATKPGDRCSASGLAKKSGNLYGTIEVGSSGIKGQVIQELAAANDEGFKLISRNDKIAERNANAVDPKAQTEAVTAVNAMYREMQEKFSIPCEQIVIYGSSGLAQKAPHKEDLAKAIEQETGKSVEFITPEAEAKYIFDGVVPTWRRNNVFQIDIGSGNTKGAYLQAAQATEYQIFIVPLGTKTFTKEIASNQGQADFTQAAVTTKGTVLVPQIRDMVQRKPGMQTIPRVYLSGGIVWALSTLIRPCMKEQSIQTKEERVSRFSRIYAEDINTFYNNVTRDRKRLFQPDLSACSAEQKQQVEKDIAKIQKDVFSSDNLIAGAEILRALSQELKFAEKERMFFARYAIEALPIGYLMGKIEKL
jgi:serine/threonine protein kinase